MKKLRFGVVGLGMGKGHALGYQSHLQAELVALGDVDEQRLCAAADEMGVPETYTDVKAMFAKANLDAVSRATPNKFHAPLTIAAFKAGLHVLSEKPMALTVKEAERMLAASKAADRNLMINFSPNPSRDGDGAALQALCSPSAWRAGRSVTVAARIGCAYSKEQEP